MLYHIKELDEERIDRKYIPLRIKFFSSRKSGSQPMNIYMIGIPTTKYRGVLDKYSDLNELVNGIDSILIAEATIITHNINSKSSSFIFSDICEIMNYDEKVAYKELSDLYVYPEFRSFGFGKQFCEKVSKYISNGNVLFTNTGASMKEFKNDPGEDKCHKIADELALFFEKCGYVSINDYSQFDCHHSLIYLNDITALPVINFYKNFTNFSL